MNGTDPVRLTIYLRWRYGDTVYLRVRDDRVRGMITAIHCFPTGATYGVTWADANETTHYEFELADEYEYPDNRAG